MFTQRQAKRARRRQRVQDHFLDRHSLEPSGSFRGAGSQRDFIYRVSEVLGDDMLGPLSSVEEAQELFVSGSFKDRSAESASSPVQQEGSQGTPRAAAADHCSSLEVEAPLSEQAVDVPGVVSLQNPLYVSDVFAAPEARLAGPSVQDQVPAASAPRAVAHPEPTVHFDSAAAASIRRPDIGAVRDHLGLNGAICPRTTTLQAEIRSRTAAHAHQSLATLARLLHSRLSSGIAPLQTVVFSPNEPAPQEVACRASATNSQSFDPILEASEMNAILSCAAPYLEAVTVVAMKLGGVVPWSPKWTRASFIYSVFLILLNLLILSFFLARAAGTFDPVLFEGAVRPLYCELALPFGSALGLASVQVFKGRQLLPFTRNLGRFAEKHGFKGDVQVSNCGDSLLAFSLWLLFVASWLWCRAALLPGGIRDLSDTAELAYFVGIIVSSFTLHCLTLTITQLARLLASTVDSFCFRVWGQMQFSEAVVEWNRIQAAIRKTSSAAEHPFCVIQLTMLLVMCLLVLDRKHTPLWALSPMVAILAAMSHIFVRAAFVTESCQRLGPVINAFAVSEEPMDQDRMYLVDYIAASAAGFYIYDVRVNIGQVVRLFHYAGLGFFTVGTQLFQM